MCMIIFINKFAIWTHDFLTNWDLGSTHRTDMESKMLS